MANHSNCLYFCQVAILFVNKMFIQDLSNSLNICYFVWIFSLTAIIVWNWSRPTRYSGISKLNIHYPYLLSLHLLIFISFCAHFH